MLKKCDTIPKKHLERLDRLSLWEHIAYPDAFCQETVWLATKVYAERTLNQRPSARDQYYGKELLEDVIDTIDDQGRLKKTEKRSRVVEFMALVWME
jgi:hypothetical protein